MKISIKADSLHHLYPNSFGKFHPGKPFARLACLHTYRVDKASPRSDVVAKLPFRSEYFFLK